jgi:hypothetical protein
MVNVNNDVFSLDKLRDIIAKNQKPEREDRSGPSIAFLPEGVHKIRWFFDPEGELYREAMAGRIGRAKFMCPNFAARTDRVGTYPECAICKHQNDVEQYKHKCRYNCMVYGYLYETKSPSEYWQPDNAYVILGNSKLRKALVEMLENLVDDGADMLMGMLTPTVKGYISSTNVTRGTQGGVAIQVLTKMADPIPLDDWYVPLTQVSYMPGEFDSEVYDAAVTEYFDNLAPAAATTDDEESDDTVTTVAEDDKDEDFTVEEVVEAAVEVAKSKAKKKSEPVVVDDEVELPDDITLDMLPEDCPGWAKYAADRPVCVLCDYNIECMTVTAAK